MNQRKKQQENDNKIRKNSSKRKHIENIILKFNPEDKSYTSRKVTSSICSEKINLTRKKKKGENSASSDTRQFQNTEQKSESCFIMKKLSPKKNVIAQDIKDPPAILNKGLGLDSSVKSRKRKRKDCNCCAQEEKHFISKKDKISKNSMKTLLASDASICSSSSSSLNKTLNSDLIVIPEADSGLSEKNSLHSGYSGSQHYDNSTSKLCNNNDLTSIEIKPKSVLNFENTSKNKKKHRSHASKGEKNISEVKRTTTKKEKMCKSIKKDKTNLASDKTNSDFVLSEANSGLSEKNSSNSCSKYPPNVRHESVSNLENASENVKISMCSAKINSSKKIRNQRSPVIKGEKTTSKQNKIGKNIRHHLSSDSSVDNSSPSSSDKTPDSNFIIVSEADSGLPEKVSISSGCSGSSPGSCSDSISKLCNNNILASCLEVRPESVPDHENASELTIPTCSTKLNSSTKIKNQTSPVIKGEKTTSKQNKIGKNIRHHLSSDSSVDNSSPSSSDKTPDSNFIIVSEADSGLPEKVSISSGCSGSSPGSCSDSISKLCNNNILASCLEVRPESVPDHENASELTISTCSTKLNSSTKIKNKKSPAFKGGKITSKQNKTCKNIRNTRLALDPSVSSSSQSSPDKTPNSDLIIISEADSGLSEKVSPSTDYSDSSPGYCNDSLAKPCTSSDLTSIEVESESVLIPYKSKCNISVTLNENDLEVKEKDKILPYELAFAATLPNLEINYENDFGDLIESNKILNTMKNSSSLSIDSNILNESVLVNNSEHNNSKQDVRVPDYLNPKKCFLSLMNQINSICNSGEDFICNDLNIRPLIKPPNYNYDENNLVNFAVDIPMLRAANDYIKSKVTTASLPDVCGSAWNNHIVRLSDPFLNISENCSNQLSSEDNVSEISISSCKTSDIQLDFFDITFSENLTNIPENIPEENLPDFNDTLCSSLNANTYNVCNMSPDKEITDNVGLQNCNNDKQLPKMKKKPKRKRCIWDTRKRRCRKKTKNKDTISKLNSELTVSKLNNALNAEIYCDTCDESELEEDVATDSEYFKQSGLQRKKISAEISVHHDGQNDINDIEENVAPSNQHVKSSDIRHFQNNKQHMDKLCLKENLKEQVVKECENPPTALNEKLDPNLSKKNNSNTFSELDNVLISATADNSNQNSKNVNIIPNPQRRKEISSCGNQEKNSIVLCETNNENESSNEVHSSNIEKNKLKKNKFQNVKQLKCSVELNILSQSCEIISKSNHSPQNNLKSIAFQDEPAKSKCGETNINENNSNFPYVIIEKLNNNILERYFTEMDVNKNSKSKKDAKNVHKESSESISKVCDNFNHEKSSENLISDSSLCSVPESSHSLTDINKNNLNLISGVKENKVILVENTLNISKNSNVHNFEDCAKNKCSEISSVQYSSPENSANCSSLKYLLNKTSESSSKNVNDENSNYCNTPPSTFSANILVSELPKNEHILMNINSSKTVSDNLIDSENTLDLKSQKNEHIHIADGLSQTVSDDQIEHVSEDETSCDDTIKSVSFNLLERYDNDMYPNSSSYSADNSNSMLIEKADNSASRTTSCYDVKNPQPEVLSRENNSSTLCQSTCDYDPNLLAVKTSTSIKDSISDNSITNKLNMDNESSETKSSNNTEPIFGITVDDSDLDFEFDQDELKNDYMSESRTSFCKSLSNLENNTLKSVSSSNIQDNLNEINTLDSTMMHQTFSFSSTGFQDTPSSFKLQESYFSFDDDDDSDSDKEYNFKRSHERRTNSIQERDDLNNFEKTQTIVQDQMPKFFLNRNPDDDNQQLITDKESESSLSVGHQSNCNLEKDVAANSVDSTKVPPRFKDVITKIKKYCWEENCIKAVEVAQTYISISCGSEVNKIFKHLLCGLFSFVKNSSTSGISFSSIFDDALNLMFKFEICDKKISSHFIIKCSEQPELSSCIEKLFDFCQKKGVPISNNAINAFASVSNLEELAISVLLKYMEYIKNICKKKIPKKLIHSALEKSKTSKISEEHYLCQILYDITPKEIDEPNLKEFLQFCFKRSMWAYVADMFMTWSSKNNLSACIYLALTSETELMATYYGKLASAIHSEDVILYPEHKVMFGQIGIALMLEAFSKKYLDCAQEILHILHTYNVNYYELELAFCKFYLSQPYADTDLFDTKTLPFLVVFVAVDICLHFEKPKDAFTIFQDFSWVKPGENLDEEVKMYVFKERYHRLMKLVPLLNNKDTLHQGWEALKILLTTIEQGLVQEILDQNNEEVARVNLEEKDNDTTKEISEEVADSNLIKERTPVQCIRLIYNEYLTSLINCNEISSAYDLYQHSLGPKNDIFTVSPIVLRGLVVAFSNSGKADLSTKVFLHGIMTDIYPIKKPEISNIPWELTIRSEWSVPEIKCAIEWFIGMLSPLLSSKPKETNFEKWFSLKIVFRYSNQTVSKIKCLAESRDDPKYYVNKTKNALQDMNPILQFTEEGLKEEALYVTSESLYGYWKTRYAVNSSTFSRSEKSYLLPQKVKRFSFGEINASCEKKKSAVFNEEDCFQSPEGLPSYLAESLVSDYVDEIRSKAGKFAPLTPETSPTLHQNVPNTPVGINLKSQETSPFTYEKKQDNSPKISDTIIQISNPSRLSTVFNNDYKNHRENVSVFSKKPDATNTNNSLSSILSSETKSKSDFQTTKNVKLSERYQLKSSAKVNSPKLKNRDAASLIRKKSLTPKLQNKGAANTGGEKHLLRLKKFQAKSNKLKSGNVDVKNLTVSFAANSSTRVVSNISVNKGTVSQNNLKNSQFLVKTPPQDSSVSKVNKVGVTKKGINLNKSNTLFPNATSFGLPNQSSTNVRSDLLVNIPVTNLNVNRTKRALKEPLTVSVTSPDMISQASDSMSNEKIPSRVISINREADTVTINNNSKQDKVSKPVIDNASVSSSGMLSQSPDSLPHAKVPHKLISQNSDFDTRVSSNNSVQDKVSKPSFKNISMSSSNVLSEASDTMSNEKMSSSLISLNRNSDTAVSSNNSVQCNVSKPIIKNVLVNSSSTSSQASGSMLNQKTTSGIISLKKDSNTIVSRNNSAQFKASKPVIKRDAHLTDLEDLNKTKVKTVPTSRSTSYSNKSLDSLPKKVHMNIEAPNSTQSEVFVNSVKAKSFSGNKCSPEEFNRINQFLKIKIGLKHKHLSPEQQDQKALILTQEFLNKNTSITKLDKRTMKLLNEFEIQNV